MIFPYVIIVSSLQLVNMQQDIRKKIKHILQTVENIPLKFKRFNPTNIYSSLYKHIHILPKEFLRRVFTIDRYGQLVLSRSYVHSLHLLVTHLIYIRANYIHIYGYITTFLTPVWVKGYFRRGFC